STKGMRMFARDPLVLEKFKQAMEIDAAEEESESSEEEEEEEESESEESEEEQINEKKKKKEEIRFKSDWEACLKAVEKRTLLADVTRASSRLGKSFSWTKANKPSWWPCNVPFQSPHGKIKTPVDQIDMVMRSFHEHQMLKIVVSN
uniref:Uncharacterized protein n=1 Tax=Clytia hemisphaerica TaxID=252671 RepID=A0A7M5UVJ9_9CNID